MTLSKELDVTYEDISKNIDFKCLLKIFILVGSWTPPQCFMTYIPSLVIYRIEDSIKALQKGVGSGGGLSTPPPNNSYLCKAEQNTQIRKVRTYSPPRLLLSSPPPPTLSICFRRPWLQTIIEIRSTVACFALQQLFCPIQVLV